ncbi:Kae1-like domain-containing protein [Serpentinimonas barnesii]|uniref:Kae1-like domain-containing protein n=1 Tax=Serpentinimonas barnesii TaxID=1458427 RepID=UPI000496ACE0|nr:hypothetical protein [Serpentinimonas barnesii]
MNPQLAAPCHRTAPTVLALGAWLKNRACLVQGGRVQWSAAHGDLSDPAACSALRQSALELIERARLAGAPVAALAHDLHPDFYSTQLALELANELGLPAVAVQHHRAHIAAVLAAQALDEPVLGLALDGFGLGDDASAWGGELLWLHGPHWQRLGHLFPLALPGGDRAARQPWRMAASALHACGLGEQIGPRWGAAVGAPQAALLQQMLARQFNCPPSSSTGRWFDAAAAALGLCLQQDDEAQAAMALEQAAQRALDRATELPELPTPLSDAQGRLDLRPLWLALHQSAPAPAAATDARTDALAAAFHLSLADGLADWVLQARRQRPVRGVALAGGCFYNAILRQRLSARLQQAGLPVWLQTEHGCGDAGLALGQAWVVAQELTAASAALATTKENEPCV